MNEPVNPEVAILNNALELAEAQRDAYLDQACAGNTALRQQVAALLQKAHWAEPAPAILYRRGAAVVHQHAHLGDLCRNFMCINYYL